MRLNRTLRTWAAVVVLALLVAACSSSMNAETKDLALAAAGMTTSETTEASVGFATFAILAIQPDSGADSLNEPGPALPAFYNAALAHWTREWVDRCGETFEVELDDGGIATVTVTCTDDTTVISLSVSGGNWDGSEVTVTIVKTETSLSVHITGTILRDDPALDATVDSQLTLVKTGTSASLSMTGSASDSVSGNSGEIDVSLTISDISFPPPTATWAFELDATLVRGGSVGEARDVILTGSFTPLAFTSASGELYVDGVLVGTIYLADGQPRVLWSDGTSDGLPMLGLPGLIAKIQF
jgi:hypothetical protein